MSRPLKLSKGIEDHSEESSEDASGSSTGEGDSEEPSSEEPSDTDEDHNDMTKHKYSRAKSAAYGLHGKHSYNFQLNLPQKEEEQLAHGPGELSEDLEIYRRRMKQMEMYSEHLSKFFMSNLV